MIYQYPCTFLIILFFNYIQYLIILTVTYQAAFDIFVDDPVEDAISANNLNRLFAMLGQTPTPEELKEMVEEIDVDGSVNFHCFQMF